MRNSLLALASLCVWLYHRLVLTFHPAGRYNKGSRIWRGGLADGWGAHGGGNILKITGTRPKSGYLWLRFPVRKKILCMHECCLLRRMLTSCIRPTQTTDQFFQSERQVVTDKLLFRGYLKIIKGKARACTTLTQCGPMWTKAITSKSTDGWHQMNTVVYGSHVSGVGM